MTIYSFIFYADAEIKVLFQFDVVLAISVVKEKQLEIRVVAQHFQAFVLSWGMSRRLGVIADIHKESKLVQLFIAGKWPRE